MSIRCGEVKVEAVLESAQVRKVASTCIIKPTQMLARSIPQSRRGARSVERYRAAGDDDGSNSLLGFDSH